MHTLLKLGFLFNFYLSLVVIFSSHLWFAQCNGIKMLNRRVNNRLHRQALKEPIHSQSESLQPVPLSLDYKLKTLSGYTEWSSYLKNGDSNALEKVLDKCYECINDKQQKKNGRAYDRCLSATGLNIVTDYGVIHAGSAFVNAMQWYKTQSHLSMASTYTNEYQTDFKAWAEYHKNSNRIENLLSKCYECIRDRKEYYKSNAFNTFSPPSYSTFDVIVGSPENNLAEWLSGPFVNTGGKFVSAGNTGPSSYGNNQHNSQFVDSLSCMVGTLGVDAYVQACEYGNSYCQIFFNGDISGIIPSTELSYASCVPICVPYHNFNGIDKSNLCTSGALSNKYNVICLIGNLASGSTGALPAMCGPGQTCGVTDNQVGYCNFASNCLSTDLGCSTADYGNIDNRGPLCFVGIFGNNNPSSYAKLMGCGKSDVCQTVISSGLTTGSCAISTFCTNTTTSTCTTVDYANKRGPICYFGQFGNSNRPQACAIGQSCQRDTVITPLGTSLSYGSCSFTCIPSATTFCCNKDLCNAYDTTLATKKCDNNLNYERSYDTKNDKPYSAISPSYIG